MDRPTVIHSSRVAAITDLLTPGMPLEDGQWLAGQDDPRPSGLHDRRREKATRNIIEGIIHLKKIIPNNNYISVSFYGNTTLKTTKINAIKFTVILLAATTYIASWFLPIFELPPRPPGLNHMNPTPNGGIWPGFLVFLFGCLAFHGYPLVPNLAMLLGLIFLARGREWRAMISGTVASVTSIYSYVLLHNSVAHLMIGYFAWIGSFLLLLLGSGGLYAAGGRMSRKPELADTLQ